MSAYSKLLASFYIKYARAGGLEKSALQRISKKQILRSLSSGRRGRRKTKITVKLSNKQEYNLDDMYVFFLGGLLS